MSIQREFVLRYRTEGHVRFQIPPLLCDVTVAKTLTDAISAIDGVYRVSLNCRQKKLSVRYQETVCDFTELAKQLYQLIGKLEKKGALKPLIPSKTKWKAGDKLKSSKAGMWANEKYTEAKETLQAAKVLAKLGIKKPKAFVKDPEQTIINFFNDVLVLYLIKIHWQRIIQEWLPHPIRHRYEWTAVFYLSYLLMRSRKPK